MLKKLQTKKMLLRITAAASLAAGVIYAICCPREAMVLPAILLVLWLLFSAVSAITMDPRDRKEFAPNHHSDTLSLLAFPGALMLLITGVLELVNGKIALGGLSLIAGACIGFNGVSVLKKIMPSSAASAIQAVAAAGRLLVRYRAWSKVPVIGLYLYPLVAYCCAVLASYHYLTFTCNKGSRARMTFCCMLGAVAFFGAAFDGAAADTLSSLGWFCFMLSELSGLTYKPKKRRVKKPVENEPEEPSTEQQEQMTELPENASAVEAMPAEEPPVPETELPEDEPEASVALQATEQEPIPQKQDRKYAKMSMFDILAEFDEPQEEE